MTPESMPRPPRKVRARADNQYWQARIFSLPFVLFGPGLTAVWLFLLLWQVCGTNIPATVTGSSVRHTSRQDLHVLKYRFQSGGETISSYGYVSTDTYESYQAPGATNRPVMIRYFAIGSLGYSRVYDTGGSLWFVIIVGALVAAVANLVGLGFVYGIWLVPRRMRRLYRYGEAVTGTFTGKKEIVEKKKFVDAEYKFRDPFSGKTFTDEVRLYSAEDVRNVAEGVPVTVLYLKEKPKCSTVYEFGGYRVEGER